MKWPGMLFLSALSICATLQSEAGAAPDIYPTNTISFAAADEIRTDWWRKNFRNVKPESRGSCIVSLGSYLMACRRVFSPDQIILHDEEKAQVEGLRGKEKAEYIRNRTSLYEYPIPITPVVAGLQSFTTQWPPKRSFPTAQYIQDIKRAGFESLDLAYSGLSVQLGMNVSLENIEINEALRVAWDYWERAADHPPVCKASDEPDIDTCVKAVRVTTAKRDIEPRGMSKGVALCRTDKEGFPSFFYECVFLTMETVEGQKYVKAVVGPWMGMGGGLGLADGFGMFMLTCDFPAGTIKTKLAGIRNLFGLVGKYDVGDEVRIRATSRFQYFEAARKFGKFQMEVSEQGITDSNSLRIVFRGKWWKENRDVSAIPLFDDEDVQQFTRIFEREIGGQESCKAEQVLVSIDLKTMRPE